MILSQEEVEIKSKLWDAENGEFMKDLECNNYLIHQSHSTYCSTFIQCGEAKLWKRNKRKTNRRR